MRASRNLRARVRGVTSRKTSALRTATLVMVRPRIAASRSRAIVSVSGNSGTAVQLAPRDVAPQLLAGERNALGVRPRQLGRFHQGRRDRGDPEHSSTGANQLCRGRIGGGPGLKDLDAIFRRWQLDRIAGAGLIGISGGGDDG